MPGSVLASSTTLRPLSGKLLDPAVVNQARHRRAARFDERGRARDDDGFLNLTEIHPEVDAQVLAGGQLGLRRCVAKPGQLRGDLVVASRHREQIEEPRFVGHSRTGQLLADHRRPDVGARNDGAAFVAHVSR